MDFSIANRWIDWIRRILLMLLVATFTVSPGSSKEVVETSDFVEEAYIHTSHQLQISAKWNDNDLKPARQPKPLHTWHETLVTQGPKRSKLYLWHSALKLCD